MPYSFGPLQQRAAGTTRPSWCVSWMVCLRQSRMIWLPENPLVTSRPFLIKQSGLIIIWGREVGTDHLFPHCLPVQLLRKCYQYPKILRNPCNWVGQGFPHQNETVAWESAVVYIVDSMVTYALLAPSFRKTPSPVQARKDCNGSFTHSFTFRLWVVPSHNTHLGRSKTP